jgi:hypothetical protein
MSEEGSHHHKADAVISISEFNESPEQAVRSVLDNAKRYFCALHIVKYGYDTTAELYPGFQADLQRLAPAVPVHWHSTADTLVTAVHGRALVHIEPDLCVKDGALKTLYEDMEKGDKQNFAVSSITYVDTTNAPGGPASGGGTTFVGAFSFGFLLVILMFDTLRHIVTGFQHHRTADLRGQLVTITYPNRVRVASPPRWWLWWLGTNTATTKHGGAACIQIPSQGWVFVLRTIKTHRGMSLLPTLSPFNPVGGAFWLTGFLLYYFLFAWPVWNYVLPDPSTASSSSMIARWLVRDMSGLHWQVLYLLHTAVVGYVAWTNIEILRWNGLLLPLLVLGYTWYLTVSPLVILYGRFHTSRAAWDRQGNALALPNKKSN